MGVLRSHNRGIINPRSSRWVPYWDGCVFVCTIFTALVTPIEVCLFSDTTVAKGWTYYATLLFVSNRVVDTFFMIDFVLQFFTAYQESPQEMAARGGMWSGPP